ncbi:hypothetical protein N7474_007600 [Penicillium riverlandense]|uniref:uncharacterized protein n=1 Tax=Penicillium riverlandense TaxID=1903569 RepID=UPI002548DC3C|nr:uncharacterized protein N7474_007600 [Penicillium riverlandense]KAJ5811299.1 hypothetical protein N7474_007600 [Penicillium riverlandense]
MEMTIATPEVSQHGADPSSHGRSSLSAQGFDDAEQAALLAHQGLLSQQSQMSNAYQQHGYLYGGDQDQRHVMSGDVSLTPSLFPPQYRQEEPLPTTHAAYPAWPVSQKRHAQAAPVRQTQTPPVRQTQSPHQLAAHHAAHHNAYGSSTATALAADQAALNLAAQTAHSASPSYTWPGATQQQQPAQLHARSQQSSQRSGLPVSSNTSAPRPILPTTTPGHPTPTPGPPRGPPVGQTRVNKRRLQDKHARRQSSNNLRIRSDVIQKIKPEDALVKTEYDPATIARDVLINSGKHPTEKFLNEHLEPLRKNFDSVDYHSDLSTFRWDIVEPVLPPAVPAAKDTESHVLDSRDRSLSPTRASATRPQSKETPSLVSPVNPPLSHCHAHPPQFLPTHSTQPPLPASIPSQQANPAPKPSPAQPSPAKAHHPPQSKDTSPLEPVLLSSGPSMPSKEKVGRAPPKKQTEDNATDDKAQVDQAPPINWPVFACKWTKCPAELHNLETLNRHIVKLHIPNNIKCGWEGCKRQDGLPANELWKHVQESHVSAVAWKLGDGPRIHSPEEQDKHRAPDIETTLSTKTGGMDPIILPAHKNAVNAYLKIHNINDSYGRAEALLRGGIHWKDQVGPTIDKSGYTLSTPARQWKTDPNEGIMELVNDDE